MTDLEMTRLCAEADGSLQAKQYLAALAEPDSLALWRKEYAPLHDDAQAMALVKRFCLRITPPPSPTVTNRNWMLEPTMHEGKHFFVTSVDLNRAIVECVAKMQAAKGKSC